MKKNLYVLLFFTQIILTTSNHNFEHTNKNLNHHKVHQNLNKFRPTTLRFNKIQVLQKLHSTNKHQIAVQILNKANEFVSSSSKWDNFNKLLYNIENSIPITIVTHTTEKSFIIPVTTTSPTFILTPLGIIVMYYATTYGTKKILTWHKQHYKKQQDLLTPMSTFDYAKMYQEVLDELHDTSLFEDDEDEQSWWKKNKDKLPLWSASFFAIYNATQIAKDKYDKTTAFEKLIDYFQNPKNVYFGENAFDNFKFKNIQNNEKIIFLTTNQNTEWKAFYHKNKNIPMIMTLHQGQNIPKECNVIKNALQQIQYLQSKNTDINQNHNYIQVPLFTKKYGTYYAFIPIDNAADPIKCYHEQAMTHNIHNIQQRKTKSLHINMIKHK